MIRLVCIVAHPDDETMLCGGTLAALADYGFEIHVLCATRGEGGELGEPPLGNRQELGQIREGEMRCACQALGVASLAFLDYIDPLVGLDNSLYPYTDDEKDLVARIVDRVRRLRPDMLLTHGGDGDYGHPAHVLTHQAVQQAFAQSRNAGSGPDYLYTFCAAIPGVEDHIFNQSEPAHLVLELVGTSWLDAKEAAALCHRTQHGLFKRRKNAETVREVLRRVESLHRHHPEVGPDAPGLLDVLNPVADYVGEARR